MLHARVVLQEAIHEEGLAILRAGVTDVQVLSGTDDPKGAEALRTADALIVRSTRVDETLIELAPRLRVIGRHGAGLDNIDLDAAKRRGVLVLNTPRANTDSVAEYVIGAALYLLRRYEETSRALVEGLLSAESSLPGQVQRAGLLGRDLQGLRLGLVGAGAIGRAVARRARAMGVIVLAYDPYADPHLLADEGIALDPNLDHLLSCSDMLSLHLPGGDATRGIIDERRIGLMPRGAVLINAARGGLVDLDALRAAVRAGQLSGAAVDVFDPEPPNASDPILHEPRILATPHMAAMTEDAVRRMGVEVATVVVDALRKTSAEAAELAR